MANKVASSQFYITALEDGETLHGNLSVDGSLSQGWDGAAASPNWATVYNDQDQKNWGTKDQPEIILTVLSGATPIGVTDSGNGNISQIKWFYNDNGTSNEISFASSTTTIYWKETIDGTERTKSVTGYLSTNGKFLKHNIEYNGVSTPCLRIVQNLASNDNVDLDTITFKGQYTSAPNGAVLDFSAMAQIRIGKMSEGGYWGNITFLNDVANITQKGQNVTMTGTLYGSTDNVVSAWKTQWYLSDVMKQSKDSGTNNYTVNESEITDKAIVKCEFYITNNGVDELVFTEFAEIDDMQDNDCMYIQSNNVNVQEQSVRKGAHIDTDIWMGTETDSTPDSSYITYQCKLIGPAGTPPEYVIDTSFSGAGSTNPANVIAGSGGWRPLSRNAITYKANFQMEYEIAKSLGKRISVQLRASTGTFDD